MKNTQSGFVGIIIIVISVLALGIGGTYYVTKEKKEYTINSTSSIQNNTNDEITRRASTTDRKLLSVDTVAISKAKKIIEDIKIKFQINSPVTLNKNNKEIYYTIDIENHDWKKIQKIENYLMNTFSFEKTNGTELGLGFTNEKKDVHCETDSGREIGYYGDEGPDHDMPANVYCYDGDFQEKGI